ncbi:MAG: methylmalonyl Co-A mutase-associated GTPase MeaB [Sediminibacterium sp.]|nr:MAG: LAO/AO transport system [Chitinophagaceae bacterium]MDP1843165.1 methylmalonyl Co-A mutase-associated GTPase MeaB [Sediminibacterium sp.]TXT33341.1 MAG: LAO/AO transport system kinase [Chitinophagaceae bacterium]
MWDQLLKDVIQGNQKSLARAISLVENKVPGYEDFLQGLPAGTTPVIGITGPPGAGKSTLVDALIEAWVTEGKKVAVICVDPSSPFNLGALLGDRIRMSDWYNTKNVFIRSLATRGSLGGLHPSIIEITALMQCAGFDQIIVETVGVGQSEIEIAGLADVTVVVVVPEAGDEIQTMKAGLMEIAQIFVVNKSDRPDADQFVKNLRLMVAPATGTTKEISVFKTVASAKQGIIELAAAIEKEQHKHIPSERKSWLFTQRAYQLIAQNKMKDIDKTVLFNAIAQNIANPSFNLFNFVKQYTH